MGIASKKGLSPLETIPAEEKGPTPKYPQYQAICKDLTQKMDTTRLLGCADRPRSKPVGNALRGVPSPAERRLHAYSWYSGVITTSGTNARGGSLAIVTTMAAISSGWSIWAIFSGGTGTGRLARMGVATSPG